MKPKCTNRIEFSHNLNSDEYSFKPSQDFHFLQWKWCSCVWGRHMGNVVHLSGGICIREQKILTMKSNLAPQPISIPRSWFIFLYMYTFDTRMDTRSWQSAACEGESRRNQRWLSVRDCDKWLSMTLTMKERFFLCAKRRGKGWKGGSVRCWLGAVQAG